MIFNREPVAILAVIQTVLALVVSFGFNLSGEQVGAIVAMSSAVLGLLARSKVAPVDKYGDLR